MDYIKLKCFCAAKENTNEMKREPAVWENICANDISGKELIFKICNQLIQHQTPPQTIQLKMCKGPE